MTELFSQLMVNLVSPPILFFALGIFAGALKSDLKVPDDISKYLSIYLMMAIGFKGGVAIAETPDLNSDVLLAILGGIGLGLIQPYISYFILRHTTNVDRPTAAAIGAHYGSISMVTFVTAVGFLEINEVIFAGYMVAVLALMEAPAILSGLRIAHVEKPSTLEQQPEANKMTREILTNGAIMMLTGSFLIGWATGPAGLEKVGGFLVDPFQGFLAFFLLDMGLVVARQFSNVREFSFSLAAFGIYMPLIGSVLGLGYAWLVGMDAGTGFLFPVLVASASYIAVPAAMRLALPEAKAAIYLPMSLAITFPFNVTVGLPLYFAAAEMLLG